MTRWAVLDLTTPNAPPVHVGRSRLYARWVAAWLGAGTVVIPWQAPRPRQ